MVKGVIKDLEEEDTHTQTSEEAFRDAGFTVEERGSVKIYRRPVSDDVIEASIKFAEKRTIGYTSKDIPGRKSKRC